MNTHGKAAQASVAGILERHYQRAADARALSWAEADGRARDCAALHVGLDAMARIQRKRPPVAPLNPEWHGTVPKEFDRAWQYSVTNAAVAILARHSQRVHDARNVVKDCSASLQATTVALVSILR